MSHRKGCYCPRSNLSPQRPLGKLLALVRPISPALSPGPSGLGGGQDLRLQRRRPRRWADSRGRRSAKASVTVGSMGRLRPVQAIELGLGIRGRRGKDVFTGRTRAGPWAPSPARACSQRRPQPGSVGDKLPTLALPAWSSGSSAGPGPELLGSPDPRPLTTPSRINCVPLPAASAPLMTPGGLDEDPGACSPFPAPMAVA